MDSASGCGKNISNIVLSSNNCDVFTIYRLPKTYISKCNCKYRNIIFEKLRDLGVSQFKEETPVLQIAYQISFDF